MLKTQAEIARLKGATRVEVSRFIKKHGIQPSGAKGKLKTYETSVDPLASYLADIPLKKKSEPKDIAPFPVPKKKNPEPPASPIADTAVPAKISKPLNDLLKDRIPSGRKPSAVFYLKALDIAEKNQDAALLFKLGQIADKEDKDEIYQQQMLKTEQAKEQIAQEKAERLKIENEIRRGQYMDKPTVKLLFGKTYAIHTSVLIPLGLKMADMLDALPPGPGRRNKMQEMIDNEMFSALETIKKLLVSFVQTGEETIDQK